MKKILFFTENNWVFGKIHNELIKALYPDVYCDIFPFNWTYEQTLQTMPLFLDKYDLFVSNTWGAYILHSVYNVPANRIIGIAHGYIDLNLISEKNREIDLKFINDLKGFGVISPHLYNLSINSDISRVPQVLRIGLHTELYRPTKTKTLQTLGYLGAKGVNYGFGDIKRAYLADLVAQKSGLNLISTSQYHFLGIEAIYKNIDLLIFCSLTEGNPYSALEAFASGVPVLGTETGLFPELANSGGGKILPFDENEFVEKGVDFINELKNNNSLYLNMCDRAYEYSKTFDWSALRNDWINYIYSL